MRPMLHRIVAATSVVPVLASLCLVALASWLIVGPPGVQAFDAPGSHNGRILVSGYLPGHRAEGTHIFSVNPDGTGLHQLTFGATFDEQPAWSPDQTRIAFQRRPLTNYQGQIWLMNADGSNQHVVAAGNAFVWNMQPAWSPNGDMIAYKQAVKGGPDEVFRFSNVVLMDANGNNPFALVNGDRPSAPVWSPTGTKIAFWNTVQFGTPGLHTIDPDGTHDVNVYPSTDLHPEDWSPDGKTIIALETSVEDLTVDLFKVGPTGGSVVKFLSASPTLGDLYAARYSPDGTRIAYGYWVNSDFGCDVYSRNADGSGASTNLTEGLSTCLTISDWGSTIYPFIDILDSPFRDDVNWVYLQGITTGCGATTYCPNDPVIRAQMATFLARALHLTGAAPDAFTDDNGSVYEPNINLVAREGIASGCGGTNFCPNSLVSREQMASFLARALHLSGPAPDAFTDDDTSIHEPNINLVAREGIATGCGGTLYCPLANVSRGQMAAFLHRAFGP